MELLYREEKNCRNRHMIVQKRRYDVYIGIDPDKDMSGYARIDLRGEGRDFKVDTLAFPDLMERLQDEYRQSCGQQYTVLVVVEASWLIQTNWHTLRRDSVALAAAKGHSVGENHMVGRLTVQMAERYGLTVREQIPLKKCWKGKDGKITADEFRTFLQCNGIEPVGRTNQENRDAGLLALITAGLNRYRQERR